MIVACRLLDTRLSSKSHPRLRTILKPVSKTTRAQVWTLSPRSIQRSSRNNQWKCPRCNWRNFSKKRLSRIKLWTWEVSQLWTDQILPGTIRRIAEWWRTSKFQPQRERTVSFLMKHSDWAWDFQIWRLFQPLFSRTTCPWLRLICVTIDWHRCLIKFVIRASWQSLNLTITSWMPYLRILINSQVWNIYRYHRTVWKVFRRI